MPGARKTMSPTLLRAGATVAALSAVGRVLGYARHVLMAALLGAGPVADAFFVAFRIPGLMRRLFADGGFGAAFIPMFAHRLSAHGAADARRFAGETFGAAALGLALLTALLELAAPWIVHLVAPGFGGDPQRHELATLLVRIMLPFVLLAALAQLLAGMLNGLGRFAAAAALPIVFNLVVMAALGVLGPRLETPAHALAWGVAAAGAVQLAGLALACRRARCLPAPVRPRITPALRRLLARAAPAMLGAGAAQATVLVDLAVASLLPAGSVSLLHYADRVARLPQSIVAGAAATALLPYLSRRPASAAAPGTAPATYRTVEAVLALSVPAAAALAIIAEPLLAVLFERGAFTAATTAAAAPALAAYAAGLPAWTLVRALGPVFFAAGDTATPMRIAGAAVVLNLALSLLLMEPLAHVGIALATAIAVWAHAGAMLAVLLRRKALAPDPTLLRRTGAIAAATLVMGLALGLARRALGDGPATGELERALMLAALVAAGLAAYAAALGATRAFRARDLARAWRSDPDAS